MTTLAVIGDIHARRTHLDPVLETIAGRGVDGILLVGDIGPNLPRGGGSEGQQRRYRAAFEGILAAVGALGAPVVWVPGNHDLPDLSFPGNVDRTVGRVAGLRVVGVGGSPDTFGFPYEWDEAEVRGLDLPMADVLLVHTPPARTPLDRVPRRGSHVGSEALRELALERGVPLVCGHIHESPGACRLGGALCLNAGGLGKPFGKAQVGWLQGSPGDWAVGHTDLEEATERWWTLEDAPDATEGAVATAVSPGGR
jgi:Icc-related predicted phosphoesterase